MSRIIGIFAIGTAISLFLLGLIFIEAFQIAQSEASRGNSEIIVPVVLIGVLVIIASTISLAADP